MEPDLVYIQVSLQIKLDNIYQQLTLFTFNPQLHTYKRAIYKNIPKERTDDEKATEILLAWRRILNKI